MDAVSMHYVDSVQFVNNTRVLHLYTLRRLKIYISRTEKLLQNILKVFPAIQETAHCKHHQAKAQFVDG